MFKLDIFQPIIKEIESACDKKYQDNKKSMRIIADHLRAATFMIAEGLEPSNKTQGYILRRLLRRAAVKMHQLHGGLTPIPAFNGICFEVVGQYSNHFDESLVRKKIEKVIDQEMSKFSQSLDKGLQVLQKQWRDRAKQGGYIPDIKNAAKEAFYFFESYGFHVDLYIEKAESEMEIFPWWAENTAYPKEDIRQKLIDEFEKLKKRHIKQSRTASFKGGLAEHSKEITKLHTATHLLHQALRDILGDHVHQKGSNITNERLRFDFSHPRALTPQEIDQIESLVNQKIKADLAVTKITKDKTTALKSGALAFFPEAYPNKVDVYSINGYSKEICGGPHVKSTAQINGIKIFKQKSASAGVRRLYAKLIN